MQNFTLPPLSQRNRFFTALFLASIIFFVSFFIIKNTAKALDDVTPPIGTVIINSGDETANNPNVALTLAATDDLSGVTEMRISNHNILSAAWEPYNAAKNWTLTFSAEEKTVYAQFKDGASNISDVVTDTIQGVDSLAPIANISSPAVSSSSSSTLGFTVNFYAYENTSTSFSTGIADNQIYYRPNTADPSTWTLLRDWTSYGSSSTYGNGSIGFQGTTGNTYYFKQYSRDNALNVGESLIGATVVPANQNIFTFSGRWSSSSNSSYYLGDNMYSNKSGNSAEYTVPSGATQLSLIATSRPTGGKAEVWINGVLQTVIDTYSSSIQYRRLLWSGNVDSSSSNTIKIVVTGTKNPSSSGTYLYLDGLGIKR